jgi:hypothetical protein
MAWRIHLSDSVVYRLDVLHGTPDVLCVWVNGDTAAFFNLDSGAALGGLHVEPADPDIERGGDDWEAYLNTLRAPNSRLLPYVRLRKLTLHRTDDDRYRLYDDGHGLSLWHDGTEHSLDADELFVAVRMDQTDGITAALDERGLLYVFERDKVITTDAIGLKPAPNIIPDVVLADEPEAIYACDGSILVRVLPDGLVTRARTLSYPAGRIACSRDGRYCATTDTDTGIIRVYVGEDMNFIRQKFAIDLFAGAEPVQLIADVPTPRLGVSALAITEEGVLAFAMDGIVTVTHINLMERMPRPQSLP